MSKLKLTISGEQLLKLFEDIRPEYQEATGEVNSQYYAMIERMKSRYRGSFIAYGVFSQKTFHYSNELNIKAHILNMALNDAIANKKDIHESIKEILKEGGYEVAVDQVEKELTEKFDEIYGSDQIHKDEIEDED